MVGGPEEEKDGKFGNILSELGINLMVQSCIACLVDNSGKDQVPHITTQME